MIFKKTVLNVIDNSGASIVKCIHVLKKGKNRKSATIGDLIKVSVKRLKKSIPKKKVKKGEVITALIVCIKKDINREIGIDFKTSNNLVVLLNKDLNNIISNRIVSPIYLEIRKTGFSKLLTLSPYPL